VQAQTFSLAARAGRSPSTYLRRRPGRHQHRRRGHHRHFEPGPLKVSKLQRAYRFNEKISWATAPWVRVTATTTDRSSRLCKDRFGIETAPLSGQAGRSESGATMTSRWSPQCPLPGEGKDRLYGRHGRLPPRQPSGPLPPVRFWPEKLSKPHIRMFRSGSPLPRTGRWFMSRALVWSGPISRRTAFGEQALKADIRSSAARRSAF